MWWGRRGLLSICSAKSLMASRFGKTLRDFHVTWNKSVFAPGEHEDDDIKKFTTVFHFNL